MVQFSLFAAAVGGTTQSPAPPEFEKKLLLNGMEVLFLAGNPERVPFLLMVKNGAAFDPVGKWGATYVMARMMLENTAKMNSELIRQELAALDARVETKVDWDALFFRGSVPASHLSSFLEILAEMMVRPGFDEATFERVRSETMEELKMRLEGPESRSQELFQAALLEGNPYSHSVKGTAETLQNLTLADIKIQYRRLLLPNQTKLALYYSGDRDALFETFSRRWGSWVRDDPAPFTFRRAQVPEKSRILLFEAAEPVILRWGKLGVHKGSRDYLPLRVLEQYLTLILPSWAEEVSGSSQIRASVQFQARRMPGYFQFNLKAPSDQSMVYLKKFQSFLADFDQGRIDADLVEESKTLILQEFSDSLQDPIQRLHHLLETELYNLGLSYISTFGLRLERVNAAALQEAVRKYLAPDHFVIVAGGPLLELEPSLASLGGTVEILN